MRIFPIVAYVPFYFPFLTKNPTATIVKESTNTSVPYWKMVFLPNLYNKYEVVKEVRTCSKFKSTGIRLAWSGRICATILDPNPTTELIPVNCCKMAIWIAINILNLLVFGGEFSTGFS